MDVAEYVADLRLRLTGEKTPPKPTAKPQHKPMEREVKESEAEALRDENAALKRRIAELAGGAPSLPTTHAEQIDVAGIYAEVKRRAIADPELLAVIMRGPAIQVTVTRHTIQTSNEKLDGMLAIFISDGFFDDGATGNAAYDELKRRGKSIAKPSVDRVADQLAQNGFFTKKTSGGYRTVAGMKVNILDAA